MAITVTAPTTDIFVIGAASLDMLHLANGQSAQAAGGSGLYTAMAAYKAGARAGLFAPKPDPLPEPLQLAAAHLQWAGPAILPEALPRLEIEHHGHGQATLLDASWGAESQLIPQIMPTIIIESQIVHIAALSNAQRQLDFLAEICRRRSAAGSRRSLLSAGTYARLVYGDTQRVRQLFERADLFFMNENEAKGLFGSVDQAQTRPDALLFVTLDAEGALVIKGQQVIHVPGHPVAEVDPTGAGDTFCGATLAGLVQGKAPVAAAEAAVKLAAQTVSVVGPSALY